MNNSNESESLFFSLIRVEQAFFYCHLISSFSCVLLKEREFVDQFSDESFEQDFLLYLITVLALIASVLCIIKFHYQFQYEKLIGLAIPQEKFCFYPLAVDFCVEFVFSFVHPNPLLKDVKFFLREEETRILVPYSINDCAIILCLARILVLCVKRFSYSKWNQAKFHRIIFFFQKQKLNGQLPLKIYLQQNQLHAMFFSLFICVFVFSSVLIVTERPFSYRYDLTMIRWEDVIWFVAITQNTIGYGDRTVKMLPSRMVTMTLIIWGNLWTSILMSTIIPNMQLLHQQEKAFNLIERLSLKRKYEKLCKENFCKIARIYLLRRTEGTEHEVL